MSRRMYGKWWGTLGIRERLSGSEELRIGKEYERYIANKLTEMKFDITDVSMRTYKDGNGKEQFYPFDLIAESPYYSLAIDVKYRRSKAPISIPKYRAVTQANFDLGVEVDDRIYIFCTPKLADSYIKIPTLLSYTEESDFGIYLYNGYYIIERYMTNSLAEVRKIREAAHLL